MKSFEEQYKELQSIVEGLEKGEVDLEKSITQFKKGLELLKSLRGQLSKVENELKEIDTNFSEEG
jgi:exodeoxyribonuclease VII small subunit